MQKANLCADKWLSPNFLNKKFAKSLQNTLSRCGLKVADIGPTFQSDHLKIDGEIFGSALDHVFFSSALENKLGKFRFSFKWIYSVLSSFTMVNFIEKTINTHYCLIRHGLVPFWLVVLMTHQVHLMKAHKIVNSIQFNC